MTSIAVPKMNPELASMVLLVRRIIALSSVPGFRTTVILLIVIRPFALAACGRGRRCGEFSSPLCRLPDLGFQLP